MLMFWTLGVPYIALNSSVGLRGESNYPGILNTGLNLLAASAEVFGKDEDAVWRIAMRGIEGSC